MVNVGKYSSPMDHMGIAKTHYITLTIRTVEEQNLELAQVDLANVNCIP